MNFDEIDHRLLNDWQRGFSLVAEPYAALGAALGVDEPAVRARLAALAAGGRISRIGGIWGAGAGGAALLCAMAVPPERLATVAAQVSAHAGVNHNYEREHRLNLWFVITGQDAASVEAGVADIEAASALPVLRLPMRCAYRIDLGFDLRRTDAAPRTVTDVERAPPVAAADRALAALLEDGLPLQPRPYAPWAEASGRTPAQVLDTLAGWLNSGTLRRFGVIVRHHEAGFAANAMTVFDVPDAQVDAFGLALARQPGVTLAYRRERAAGWPYNLYCMVHGRSRDEVMATLARVRAAAALTPFAHAVLFSRRRFKQTGARYFRPPAAPQGAGTRRRA